MVELWPRPSGFLPLFSSLPRNIVAKSLLLYEEGGGKNEWTCLWPVPACLRWVERMHQGKSLRSSERIDRSSVGKLLAFHSSLSDWFQSRKATPELIQKPALTFHLANVLRRPGLVVPSAQLLVVVVKATFPLLLRCRCLWVCSPLASREMLVVLSPLLLSPEFRT